MKGFCLAPRDAASDFDDHTQALLSNTADYVARSGRGFSEYQKRPTWRTSMEALIQSARCAWTLDVTRDEFRELIGGRSVYGLPIEESLESICQGR